MHIRRGGNGSGRASRSLDRDQRHSLVLRRLLYSGIPESAGARVHASSRRSTHLQLPRAWGRGLVVPRVLAARKRTNEGSCITVLFSKKSKPSESNDPQCKEDDTALALKNNVFAIVAVVRACADM